MRCWRKAFHRLGIRPSGGPPQPPKSAQASAPADFTGYLVSVVTEDWRWRMVTPIKGDFASIPLNNEGRRVGNAWDPDKDTAAGEQCKSYGAPAIMRVPGPRPHQLGRREHAQGRDRRRNANAAVSLSPGKPTQTDEAQLGKDTQSRIGNGRCADPASPASDSEPLEKAPTARLWKW